ncbi:unnamed protein product [Acanthoscelides obtectus]|uniref:HTH CENPB-type domain-containing protein n=1 Tax=Acanthoscelides obtectus TaxID=200917 RepID=A0A9P0JYU3_ACAOB|nr:unnamed protein product [Acanthoscelides obtectus]CAK1663981.1 Tigger transposable element-derived protein 1 [Acanthoscelides obtectus]
MDHAINAYKQNQCGFNECCRRYNIPKPTFRRHLRSLNKKANENVKSLGRHTTFSPETEMELAKHILKLEERFFGVTIRDVRRLAFQIAVRNDIPHRFNINKEMAGKGWYYSFMNRHPELSLRQPEKISMARATGFNQKNVHEFFDILERCVDENCFTAQTTYNVDESGFSTVQKRNQKIIARRGKHQVGDIASGERGVNTTVVVCASAAGQTVPPMIIFKRKRMAPELTIGAISGTIVTISDTGYINSELFVKWLKHFIEYVKPSTEKKVLLLLDGHTMHSKNLEAFILAKMHGIVLLQLPGHTTNRLQPLDVSFFKPMESYFSQGIETFLRSNPGNTVTQYNMTGLLSDAYAKTASISNVMGGFKRTGIWPVDRTVFSDADFIAASALLENDSETAREDLGAINPRETTIEPEDEATERPVKSNSTELNNNCNSTDLNTSIEEIYPLPENKGNAKKRKLSQPAVILSSTPYKDELESKRNQRQNSIKKVKKNLGLSSTSLFEARDDQSSTSKSDVVNAQIEYDTTEWYCHICEENIIQDMVKCMKCEKWAHTSCAGTKKQIKKYVCENCK